MVDEKIPIMARAFSDYWNRLFAGYPKYTLDFSWPSVGVVDLILTPLRYKDDLGEAEQELLLGASAYIASMCHDCWCRFPGEPSVRLTLSDKPEITLTISGTPYLEEELSYSIRFVETIGKILSSVPSVFPFFEEAVRYVIPTHNLLSLFAIGAFAGLSPYGEGPWRRRPAKDVPKNLYAVAEHLALGTADYYAKVFPNEPLGAKTDLYTHRLILPPAGYSEPFPCLRAASLLLNFMKEENVEAKEMITLALNLGQSPDELLSTTSFAFAAALCETSPDGPLRALGESLGNYRIQLRPAVMMLRKAFGRPYDWFEELHKEKSDEALKLVRLDKLLGLIPHFKLPVDAIGDKKLDDVLSFIAWSQPFEARVSLEEYSSADSLSPQLLIQAVHLDLAINDLERAEQDLSLLGESSASEGTPERHRIDFFSGNLAEMKDEIPTAVGHYEKAFRNARHALEDYVSSGNALARCLIRTGRPADALIVLDAVLKQDTYSLPALVNRQIALVQLGRTDQVEENQKSLYRLTPMNRAGFGLLTGLLSTKLAQSK